MVRLMLALVIAAAVGGCAGDAATQPAAPLGAAHVVGHVRDLSRTTISSVMDVPLTGDQNVIWCASFQLAWDELAGANGAPLRLAGDPPLALALERERLDRAVIADEKLVVAAGLLDQQLLNQIEADIRRKFPAGVDTRLLNQLRAQPPDSVVAYAYLESNLPFKVAFERSAMRGFAAGDGGGDDAEVVVPIASFGTAIRDDAEQVRRQREQVQVLWHEVDEFDPTRIEWPRQSFILELQTRSNDDRVILAMIPPRQTLAQTAEEVLKWVHAPATRMADLDELQAAAEALMTGEIEDEQSYTAAVQRYQQMESAARQLLPLEEFTAPIIDFDLLNDFDDLMHRVVSQRAARRHSDRSRSAAHSLQDGRERLVAALRGPHSPVRRANARLYDQPTVSGDADSARRRAAVFCRLDRERRTDDSRTAGVRRTGYPDRRLSWHGLPARAAAKAAMRMGKLPMPLKKQPLLGRHSCLALVRASLRLSVRSR